MQIYQTSYLSDDESSYDQEPCDLSKLQQIVSDKLCASDDEDDDTPLAALQQQIITEQQKASTSGSVNVNNNNKSDRDNHVYRRRKRDLPNSNHPFTSTFSEPPDLHEMTPLTYFLQFFPENLLDDILYQTNLYSVQKSGKSINCSTSEVKMFIGINIMMGIIKLPFYYDYWNTILHFAMIANVMSRNRFSMLRQYLHFVDNNTDHNSNDKLFKIRPIIEAVRNETIKVEPEEFQSVDEQITPSKTKYSGIRQ